MWICKNNSYYVHINRIQEVKMSTMKALVFKDIGKIDFEQIPIPKVTQPNQILIKVAACGICGTDVKIMQGKHAFNKNTVSWT